MPLRGLPKIDEVLGRADVAGLGLPRWAARAAVRAAVEARRQALLRGEALGEAGLAVGAAEVRARAEALVRPTLRAVINATGVVLHTNLGRAPLAPRAVAALVEAATRYVSLEMDLGGGGGVGGGRGSRHDHVEGLLGELCGAEAACVVNNNAAAVLLCIAAMADGRDAIVSRGELVEIGGSFRIPDVMRQSGARLVEVGTTNRTRVSDYEAALGSGSASSASAGLLLKVHRSNFAMVGFVAEATVDEVVALGRARGVPVMVDLGSGSLVELGEPTVPDVVRTGADLVTFSGDKLLGGPQAGVIVGRADAVDRVKRHPLMRALRPDKLTLAALAATLAAYRDGEVVPALAMLRARPEELRARAETLRARAGGVGEVVELRSLVGGGALPTTELASWGLALDGGDALAASLRAGDPPVIARIDAGRVLLDVRTILEDELDAAAAAVRRVCGV